MSNLVKHAEAELKILGMGPHDESVDPMNRLMGKQILQIVKTFSKQGHSGFSANYAANLADSLLRFEPASPLTGEPDEWQEVGENLWQNRRCSHVFKDPDHAYDIEGRIFRDKDGSTWTNGKSHVTITFPYTPKRKYVERRWWKFWL